VVRRFNLDRDNPGRPVTLYHAVGCAACRGTGFRGRRAIAEFLEPNDEVQRLIFSRADHNEVERAAIAAGMVPIFRAGLEAALAGDTTIEEVVRTIQADSS